MARWITFILAIIGAAVGIYAVSTAKHKAPELELARPAPINPYARGVAALGIIEPAGRDTSIIAPEPGLVLEVFVQVGEKVKAGEALYRLDTRRLEADLLRAESAVGVAKAEIAKWHALPRAEDLPPLEAAVSRADVVVKDREENLRLVKDAVQRAAANSRGDLSAAQYGLDAAQADLSKAKADLAKAKAGGWQPDLVVAEATLNNQEKDIAAIKLLIERLTVRAPSDGVILRRDLQPGEYATTDPGRTTLILGDLTHLYVRAQVDEEDIALVGDAPKAIARTRGATPEEIPLRLVRIEPYARPKTDLLGVNSERVDTRVVDVVFETISPPKSHVFPGLGVDVFIDAKP